MKMLCVKIVRYANPYRGGGHEVLRRWDYPPATVMNRYWFFRYIESLYQIETPKRWVELITAPYDAEDTAQHKARVQGNAIRAAKARMTKIENAMRKFEAEHAGELLPINDHPIYINMKAQLCAAENKLKEIIE
jgi:hypothetical protein